MSVSSVSLSSDANVRYQRLAQEYTKLRAQAKVLREGVLEERTRVEKLTEELKSKDAAIRRLEAENEALTFRNDQLARRVETLQSTPKATSSVATSSEKTELLEAELRRKLTENERLHSQIAENERQHAVEMAEMSEKLAKEMRRLEEDVRKMRQKSKIAEKIVENESRSRDEGVEQIGSPEPPDSIEEVQLMVAEAVRHNFYALHNVFSLLQQRTEIYPFDITMERLPPHVEKLSSEYAQIARIFSDLTSQLDESLQAFPETNADLADNVISKLHQVSAHFRQMLPELVRQMTSEESRVTWCTAPLANINNQWETEFLEALTVFQTLADQLKTENRGSLLEFLEKLSNCAKTLSETFRSRWQLESRLPTTTRRMRCVGVALEGSLTSWAQESEKLSARAMRIDVMLKNCMSFEKSPEEQIEEENNDSHELPSEIENSKAEHTLNPFDDDDDEEDDCELPESGFSASDAQKWVEFKENAPISRNSEENEISHLISRNEQLQKERDRLLVDFSLVKRKFEIATGEKFKLAPETPEIDQIWACGMEKRDEWIRKVYEAEKAVRYYKTECDLLLRHELASEENIAQMKFELCELAEHNQKLEDELESVRRGYEAQLGDLSEHLASLVTEKEKEKEASKSKGSLKSFFNKA